MNPSSKKKVQKLLHLLFRLVLSFAQITLPVVALLWAIQPTPLMVQEATRYARVGTWFAGNASQPTSGGQGRWGTPRAAFAATSNQEGATLIVNTTADNATAGDTNCTLREAITNANSNSDTTGGDCLAGSSAHTDTITFNIPGAGPHTIAPTSALPTIIDSVTIDGSSQPGASCSARNLLIEINGAFTKANGLTLATGSDGSTIRGVTINRFTASGAGLGDGIHLAANQITIQCNHLGTDVTGTAAHSNDAGISLASGVTDILIGGATATERNLISGNFDGILGDGVNEVVIQGNYIGTDSTGTADLGNINDGIQISGNTTIGGTTAGTSNLIAGNGKDGIQTGGGTISGNLIGTNWRGTVAIPNSTGIFLTGVAGVMVGGTNALARNLISGNSGSGIVVAHDASNHIIQGNYIGTDINGIANLGNGADGVVLNGSANQLGGAAGAGNLISGNNGNGVLLTFGFKATVAAHDNRVQGNSIGTDVSGTIALGNTQNGVLVNGGAANNLIGTDGDGVQDEGERNLISGNAYNGVWMTGAGTAGNVVTGNYIGVDATGTTALANVCSGVVVTAGAANNRIGTNGDGNHDAAERNLIAGNGGDGVYIANATTNTVAGNYIGVDVTGVAALGNAKDGIELSTSAAYNRIGTDGNGIADEAERNLIAGNGMYGILLQIGAFANTIAGNTIGADVSGAMALGNTLDGISLRTSATHNRIGGSLPAQQNIIVYQGGAGVSLAADAGSDNAILGNRIVNNGGLGIDLGATGVTANDAGDGDSGANDLLNHPLIQRVNGTTVNLAYDVPAGNYLLQIYDNPDGVDTTGYGEGERVIYSNSVTITASGMNHLVTLSTMPSNSGQQLTATLTEDLGSGNYGSTSEFSGPDPIAHDDNVSAVVSSTGNVFSVVANDRTAWYTDTLTLLSVGAPTGGTITSFNTSSITYTAPSMLGAFSFTYTVKNVLGITDTAAVTVTVVAANRAPTITQPTGSPASLSIPENSTAITDVNTTDDSGVEGNGTLTYTLSGVDAAAFTIDASGHLAFSTAPDFETPGSVTNSNSYLVTVTVADAGGLTDSQAILVTVTDIAESVPGIEYKIVYNTQLQRYEIWMRATVTPDPPKTTGTAQVTIKAPHLTGSGTFTPTNLTAQVTNTAWSVTSRMNGAAADSRADYISFSLDFPTDVHTAIDWQAGQEILMVTFQNGGICAGPVTLMENNDPFNVAPNNPSQEIDVIRLGSDPGNDFLGNYGLGQGDCDRDGDGVVNGSDLDDDNDGLLDSVEGDGVAEILTVDSDSDGIPDILDLDSDGDSIPDNIEAQTTAGYVTPSGSVTADGIDTVYSPSGLTPVNTDGADTPDYRDLNSDNAQGDDTSEAALTKGGVDTDKDGIDDHSDSNATGFGPVNAGIITPATTYPNSDGEGDVDYRDSSVAPSVVTVPVKLFLNGAYNSSTALMRDDLRSQGLLPVTSPYTHTQVVTTAQTSVFSVTGNNAIVDWVLVEVRAGTLPTNVLVRQAALLQRDGDIVAVDGSSPLTITLTADNYYVSVRHRNHLGVMTGAPVALSRSTALLDFTVMSATHGVNAQRVADGVYGLWAGDANRNGQIIAAGPGNELNFILGTVLNAPGNPEHNRNYIVVGYADADLNLDGQVIASGPGNEINYIYNSVFLHPDNTTIAANYIIEERLP